MQKIENWLNSRIGLNFRSGLSRMEKAVELFDFPQESYPIIHVTGTNGKGSTIAFMNHLFTNHDRKVGTFTSPHIVSVYDRICIGNTPISAQDFERLGEQVQAMEQVLLETHDCLSYFEILTLIALLYFKEQEVDIALIEVGIGGLLDTTNVVKGTISIITSVGLDHQETLGETVAQITEQKAGIFKKDQLAAMIGPIGEESEEICRQKASELDIPLHVCGKDFKLVNQLFTNSYWSFGNLKLGLEGEHQEANAALALEAFLQFSLEEDWDIDIEQIGEALERTRWAGRLEEVAPNIYLDGAHNLPAIETLVSFIQSKGATKATILFGALKRKDYTGMLNYLTTNLPETSVLVTSFDYEQSLEENEIINDYPYIENYPSFIDDFKSQAREDEYLFVTGSLYFISEVRSHFID